MKRIYNLNESYFDDIDTHEKAYWLGFIFADGCVLDKANPRRQNVLSVKLGTDFNHLFKLAESLETSKAPKLYVSNNGYNLGKSFMVLDIISDQIYNSLYKLGCTPKKSLTLRFPILDEEFKCSFCLGYFDGDGSIGVGRVKSKNNWEYPVSSIISTYEFLNEYLKCLEEFGMDCPKKPIYKDLRNETYSIKLSGRKRCKILFDYLYQKSPIFLPRKLEKFNYFFKLR